MYSLRLSLLNSDTFNLFPIQIPHLFSVSEFARKHFMERKLKKILQNSLFGKTSLLIAKLMLIALSLKLASFKSHSRNNTIS
jgi:hypothetical protein